MSNKRKVYYYCTCFKTGNIRKDYGRYRLVKVNSNGVCNNCGHYTVASDIEVEDSMLIRYVTREVKAHVVLDEVGGFSVKAMKVSKKKLNKG